MHIFISVHTYTNAYTFIFYFFKSISLNMYIVELYNLFFLEVSLKHVSTNISEAYVTSPKVTNPFYNFSFIFLCLYISIYIYV